MELPKSRWFTGQRGKHQLASTLNGCRSDDRPSMPRADRGDFEFAKHVGKRLENVSSIGERQPPEFREKMSGDSRIVRVADDFQAQRIFVALTEEMRK